MVTKYLRSDKPLEIVGSNAGPPDNGASTWFPATYLGTSGGVSGTANGSAGFGIGQLGNRGHSSAVEGVTLFINNQALLPSAKLTVTAGLMLRAPADTDPEVQDLDPGSPNSFLVVFQPTLTTDPVTMSGLKVQQQLKFDYYDKPLMRTYTTFENPTNQDITVPVSWATNFAYDDRTQIKGTGSGDTLFTLDDRWLVADDDNPEYNGAAIGQLFYGPGVPGLKPASVSQAVFNTPKPSSPENRQGTAATFNLTVPANSTRSLLFFTANTGSTDTALSTMRAIDTNDRNSGLFGDLNDQQLAQIVNWDFGTGITVTPVGGTTTSEAGGTASFNIVLKSQPSSNVTLNLASSNPQEGAVSTNSLTFTPANWNQPQSLTVTGVDDAGDDGDVAYSILTRFSSSDSLYSVNEPVDIALVNLDNDSATVPTPVNPGPGGPASTIGQTLKGTKGKNQLTGSEGDDVLLGLGGNDKLTGLGGNDRLAGGKGRNQLLGGAGADLFELSKAGTAVIQDFQDGLDRLALPKGLSFRGLDLERKGNNLLVERGDQVLAVLQGVKPKQISSLDFSE
jgi:hypothetical protein